MIGCDADVKAMRRHFALAASDWRGMTRRVQHTDWRFLPSAYLLHSAE